jgi:uncharacterized membrane protein (DUF485 family)
MPMLWRRIAWFTSFALAVTLALWMRSWNYGWSATLVVAVVTWVFLPFVISQLCAAFVLARMHRRLRRYPSDELAKKITDATKGLSPEQQEAVAKRMIDEAFKIKQ